MTNDVFVGNNDFCVSDRSRSFDVWQFDDGEFSFTVDNAHGQESFVLTNDEVKQLVNWLKDRVNK